jgi:DNA polymerase III subunit gamma/tau
MSSLLLLNSATRVKKKNNLEDSVILFLTSSEKITLENDLPPVAAVVELSKKSEEKPVSPEKPEVKVVQKKVIGGDSLSIKDALKDLGKNTSTNGNENEGEGIDIPVDYVNEEPEKILSESEIMHVWKLFTNTLSDKETRMYNALGNQDPQVDTVNRTITVLFRNKALVAEFKERFKADLVGFFNKQMDISGLFFTEKVLEADEAPQTKYYTDADKLKFMIEKNPLLGQLKQEFNLDFE